MVSGAVDWGIACRCMYWQNHEVIRMKIMHYALAFALTCHLKLAIHASRLTNGPYLFFTAPH